MKSHQICLLKIFIEPRETFVKGRGCLIDSYLEMEIKGNGFSVACKGMGWNVPLLLKYLE